MNSAAVIGRQLRQQQTATGRTSGPLVPPSPHRSARPRTPSHQPYQPQQQLPSPPPAGTTSVYTIQSTTQNPKDPHQQDSNQKKKGIDKMKSCISFRCIWLCCKSLSGGVLMIAIGVGMTVFGFYADTFAVHEEYQESTNKTVEVIDEDLKYHIHNLSFVGPVFMGLGGMLIVAACVLIYDTESNSRVAPIKGTRPSDEDTTLTEHLINPHQDGPVTKSERLNGPVSPFLPNHSGALLPGPGLPNPVQDKGGGDMTTIAEVQVLQPRNLPNGPSRGKRPKLPLPVHQATSPPSETTTTATQPSTSTLSSPFPNPMLTRTTMNKKKRHFLSPLFDEFVPSPQDIQIPDPDGCTPDSSLSLEMDVYVTKCPRTVKVQLEPRYLASIESDGLSDSDTAESEFTIGGSSSILSGSSRIGGVKGRFCSPCEIEEQDIPLLGRCSPPSSPEYPLEPLLKRDRSGLRRFPLLRHPATLHHNSRMLFDGPSDGASR